MQGSLLIFTTLANAFGVKLMAKIIAGHGLLPLSRQVARVRPVRKTPTTAAITTGVIALVSLYRLRIRHRMEHRKGMRQLCRALLMLQGTISLNPQ